MKILCIGCGNMMRAIFEKKNIAKLNFQFYFFNRTPLKAKKIAEFTQSLYIKDIEELESHGSFDFIFIGVKPQDFESLTFFSKISSENTTVVSIMAGKQIEYIKQFTNTSKVVRIMPNLSAFVEKGVYLYHSKDISFRNEENPILKILNLSGTVINCPTELSLDELTLYSGCLPGILTNMFSHLEEQIQIDGVTTEDKLSILSDTLLGSATYISKYIKEETFQEMTTKVSSKGGVTQKLNQTLNNLGFKEILKKSFQAALDHTKNLE